MLPIWHSSVKLQQAETLADGSVAGQSTAASRGVQDNYLTVRGLSLATLSCLGIPESASRAFSIGNESIRSSLFSLSYRP